MLSWVNLLLLLTVRCIDMNLTLGNDSNSYIVYQNNSLQHYFNDSVYDQTMNCKNGQLQIIEFSQGEQLTLKFEYMYMMSPSIPLITVQLQDSFIPIITNIIPNKSFQLLPNCPKDITSDNYFNKITITINQLYNNSSYPLALFINCDKGTRHKKFEIGYVLIAFINGAITIGVAFYSRVWSIRYKGSSIHIQATWQRFVILMFAIAIVGVPFYIYATNLFSDANQLLRIIGIVISAFFVFICTDEIFFLSKLLKLQLWKFVRRCDIISGLVTILVITLGVLYQNWIVSNIMAICICVGSIKFFKFRSLAQAIHSLGIYVAFVTVTSIILHYTLPRSYNDYASELSSPLFILIPDLVNNLFKKCSWLPVLDIIIPGIMLAYLRAYDQNYNTGWGGVYTVIGNLSFLLSTILWVGIQAFYPFSVPFSLVTYPILILSICFIALRRNQLKTLWTGRFNMGRESQQILIVDGNKSFQDLLGNQVIDPQKYRASFSSVGQNQEKKQIGKQ